MRYELFLRSSTSISEAQMDQLRQAVDAADGPLELEPFVADGKTMGVDLSVDVDHPRGSQTLCQAAFEGAEAHGLAVFDPQLSLTVTAGQEEEIQRQFDQCSSFSQAALVTPSTTDGSTPSTLWVWLVVIGSGVLLFLVSKLSC